jgi:hypothetical protein
MIVETMPKKMNGSNKYFLVVPICIMIVFAIVFTFVCAHNKIHNVARARERAILSIVLYVNNFYNEYKDYPDPKSEPELDLLLKEYGGANWSPGLNYELDNSAGYKLMENSKSFRSLFKRDRLISDGILGPRWESSGDGVSLMEY